MFHDHYQMHLKGLQKFSLSIQNFALGVLKTTPFSCLNNTSTEKTYITPILNPMQAYEDVLHTKFFSSRVTRTK